MGFYSPAMKSTGSRRARLAVVVAGIALLTFLMASQLTLSGASWAAVQGANPHEWDNKESCSACHGSLMPSLKLDAVTLCTRCHKEQIGNHPVAKHPIGKRPKINISRRMPLDESGKLVCYTCHDSHNRSKYANMLRIDYLRLCSACHRGY